MDCYRYAAQEGVIEAYNNIGVFFGMTDRIEEAVPWFEGAADAGLATGMMNLMAYYGSKGDSDRLFFMPKSLLILVIPLGCGIVQFRFTLAIWVEKKILRRPGMCISG